MSASVTYTVHNQGNTGIDVTATVYENGHYQSAYRIAVELMQKHGTTFPLFVPSHGITIHAWTEAANAI